VHFIRGYLQAPASIDMSAVTFVTTKEFVFDDQFLVDDDNINKDDDIVATDSPEGNDAPTNAPVPVVETSFPTVAAAVPSTPVDNNTDPTMGGEGVDETTAPPEGDGGNRLLQRELSSFQTTRTLDDGSAKQIMDIVLFMVPEDCKKDSWGTCDWAKLGVGAYDDKMEGGMSYCCSADTAGRGLCNEDDIGTLIVNNAVFQGDHRKVIVPQSTDQKFNLTEAKFDIENSGEYVLVISNCNDFGLEVLAFGNMEWKSANGNLPGDMFGLMLFYGALTVFYFFLVVWYYCGMRVYQDASIPIQKYILGTMLLGLFEVLLRTTDLVIWNDNGLRNNGVMYTGQSFLSEVFLPVLCTNLNSLLSNFVLDHFPAMSLGVLKRGVSRCLGVMVAMGWGVVRDSLGPALVKIIVLGILYSALTLARDFFIVAAEDVQTISMSTKYYELMDFAWILTLLVILINLIFYFWIIFASNSTTEYLRNMNQTSKLKRHLKLRCLILTSLIIVGIW
jgi:Lung seven transmembrane receptor